MNKWNIHLSSQRVLLCLCWNREVTRNCVHTYTHTYVHIQCTIKFNISNQHKLSKWCWDKWPSIWGNKITQTFSLYLSYIKDLNDFRDFPGGPEVKILHFHCRELQIPQSSDWGTKSWIKHIFMSEAEIKRNSLIGRRRKHQQNVTKVK